MDQSAPQNQLAGNAAQVAYTAPAYQPAAMVASGAPAVLGSASPTEPAAGFPTSPSQLPGQHQLTYQQFQQFHQQQQQHQQQQLQAFWSDQILEIEQTTDFKNHSLPLARIKKIMKADEDVRMISSEAPIIFAKACEMFILELTLRSWINTEENKRRTLQKNDIAAAITRTDIFDFLVDIVPRDELKEEGISLLRGTLPAVGAPADAIPYYYVPAQAQGMMYVQPSNTAAYMSWPQPMTQPSEEQDPSQQRDAE